MRKTQLACVTLVIDNYDRILDVGESLDEGYIGDTVIADDGCKVALRGETEWGSVGSCYVIAWDDVLATQAPDDDEDADEDEEDEWPSC